MKQKRSKHSTRILITIIVAMALIVSAWSIWFLPRETSGRANDTAFSGFKSDIAKAFSVFAPQQQDAMEKADINDLRNRVFGDSTQQ